MINISTGFWQIMEFIYLALQKHKIFNSLPYAIVSCHTPKAKRIICPCCQFWHKSLTESGQVATVLLLPCLLTLQRMPFLAFSLYFIEFMFHNSILLQALKMQGKHSEAVLELSKICVIHHIFPPEESSVCVLFSNEFLHMIFSFYNFSLCLLGYAFENKSDGKFQPS